VTGY